MQTILDNLPLTLAILLALSETLALIPALKENSILQVITKLLRKAKEMFPKKEEKKEEAKEEKAEEKKEDDK